MKRYAAIGRMFALLLAASGLNACVGTTTAPQGSPQTLLAAVTKSDVREFWTNDFGRVKRTGGFSAIVPVESAQTLLESIRGKVPAGYVAFVGTTHNLDDPRIKGAELVVAPGQDQFDIVRLAATDAVNHDMTADQIIEELKRWDGQFGIDIWQAETDTVQLKLKSIPEDLPEFSQRLYEFCPDIVDQGVGDIESLQAGIKQEGVIVLWWD
ncbi:DUF4253 domain-containing protein [Stenotrophomonas sp.]|uniref:DUF4253 domain-containing protein n=1 Tax=Stenotrophomonas sp. TaxID=69392 RepID=UPI0028AE95E1|nr:DUF4253 domain-containing protein [Stenotrophomonas sp.]